MPDMRSYRKTLAVIFILFIVVLFLAACSKGEQKKDKARTDELQKKLEAQRKEAERLARERAAEAKLCVASASTEFQACADGIDNDCDKMIDCQDTEDCAADPACEQVQEGGPSITEIRIGE